MRTVLITAADEAFAPLLMDLLSSLAEQARQPFDAIGILDVGLSGKTARVVREKVDHIVEPDWDLPIDAALREQKPHLRALTARPFLRKYFPGYDTYLWIDADTWVQDAFALEWFVQASRQQQMGLASQMDPGYRIRTETLRWRLGVLKRYFADDSVHLAMMQQYYNAGVFALGIDAPHWQIWERYFRHGLQAAPHIVCDQNALNYAIWKQGLAVHALPAICNWCCHMGAPTIGAGGRLFEPFTPHRLIGVVHLTANTKDVSVNVIADGKPISGTLRFRGLAIPGFAGPA